MALQFRCQTLPELRVLRSHVIPDCQQRDHAKPVLNLHVMPPFCFEPTHKAIRIETLNYSICLMTVVHKKATIRISTSPAAHCPGVPSELEGCAIQSKVCEIKPFIFIPQKTVLRCNTFVMPPISMVRNRGLFVGVF